LSLAGDAGVQHDPSRSGGNQTEALHGNTPAQAVRRARSSLNRQRGGSQESDSQNNAQQSNGEAHC